MAVAKGGKGGRDSRKKLSAPPVLALQFNSRTNIRLCEPVK